MNKIHQINAECHNNFFFLKTKWLPLLKNAFDKSLLQFPSTIRKSRFNSTCYTALRLERRRYNLNKHNSRSSFFILIYLCKYGEFSDFVSARCLPTCPVSYKQQSQSVCIHYTLYDFPSKVFITVHVYCNI